jgi:hypothetical protein
MSATRALGATPAAIAIAAARSATNAPAPHAEPVPARRCCAIVELRQYTLHPGRFDGFAKLFEDAFFDPLEAAGMTVIGTFRDLDDPNRFVWLRGFRDMPARAAALSAFYDGPVWKARRNEANDNFTDTDNVLLLHPAFTDSGVPVAHDRPPQSVKQRRGGEIIITVYPLDAARAGEFPDWFRRVAEPALASTGISIAAAFETERSANNFPRLPVREGEHAFVWIAKFDDHAHADAALKSLKQSSHWQSVAGELGRRLIGIAQLLRLQPTPRSRLRGG